PIANFTDIAEKAGLTMQNIFGGVDTKKYIIETTGTGVAIFDYDNDGWPDIFIVNGTKLEGFPSGQAPTNHLYRNNHDGTFTDVTMKSGLAASGWGQGVCVGDYDNDGWEDLYVVAHADSRSEEHTSELQSRGHLVCRLLLEKKKKKNKKKKKINKKNLHYSDITTFYFTTLSNTSIATMLVDNIRHRFVHDSYMNLVYPHTVC